MQAGYEYIALDAAHGSASDAAGSNPGRVQISDRQLPGVTSPLKQQEVLSAIQAPRIPQALEPAMASHPARLDRLNGAKKLVSSGR
jgi:hypothetical protein